MKNKYFFGLLLLTLACTIASAQSLVGYTWDTYKIKFKISSDMNEVVNNADKFEVSSHNITMDIYPRKGENLTYSGMKSAIVAWAGQESLSYSARNINGDDQPIYLKDLNGYWGCAIDGTKGSSSATMLLLVDPDYPEISFYVWVAYNDGYYQDALQIIKSFQPMR